MSSITSKVTVTFTLTTPEGINPKAAAERVVATFAAQYEGEEVFVADGGWQSAPDVTEAQAAVRAFLLANHPTVDLSLSDSNSTWVGYQTGTVAGITLDAVSVGEAPAEVLDSI